MHENAVSVDGREMNLRRRRSQWHDNSRGKEKHVTHARLHREDQPLHFQGFPINHTINTRDERR